MTSTRSFLTPLLLLGLFVHSAAAAKWDENKQAELDAACEQAREEKLAPIREKYIEECVANKEQADRESCERFYADYGAQSGQRAPLFYDLPACEKAFNYQNGRD